MNWVECAKGREIDLAFYELSQQLCFERGSVVAIVNVLEVRQIVNRDCQALNIVNKSVDDWCCHSEIVEVHKNDRKTQQELCNISEIL